MGDNLLFAAQLGITDPGPRREALADVEVSRHWLVTQVDAAAAAS
jgi:hypothetical protein